MDYGPSEVLSAPCCAAVALAVSVLLDAAPTAAADRAAAAPPGPRRAEVEAYVRFAEATHPRGREAAGNPVWRARAEALKARADTLSEGAYAVELMRLAAWFQDGHTTFWAGRMSRGPFAPRYPFGVRAFYDGLYVVRAKGEAMPLLGARVDRVGGVAAAVLVKTFAAFWPGNNPAWAHHDVGLLFATPGFLQGIGVLAEGGTRLSVEATTASGARVTALLSPREDGNVSLVLLDRPTIRIETWAASKTGGNWIHLVPDASALYVSFDNLGVGVEEAIAFTRMVLTGMADPRVKRVIFDLRRNGGGDNFLAEPLRREVTRSRFNHPGGLYVLVGPTTFSAAQNFCNRLERETHALFVGEPTGGAPNHYGDAKEFVGAASGMAGGVSSLPWFDSYPMDQRIWIVPDLPAPQLFSDWFAGRDLALETALADPTDASPNEFSQVRVFFFRRTSQELAWKPFWLQ